MIATPAKCNNSTHVLLLLRSWPLHLMLPSCVHVSFASAPAFLLPWMSWLLHVFLRTVVARVTVDAMVHVLLHFAGVAVAFLLMWLLHLLFLFTVHVLSLLCVQLPIAACACAVGFAVTIMCTSVLQRTLLYLLLSLVLLLLRSLLPLRCQRILPCAAA